MNFKFLIKICINFLGTLIFLIFSSIAYLYKLIIISVYFLGKPHSIFLLKLKKLLYNNFIYLFIILILNLFKIILIIVYIYCIYKVFLNYEFILSQYFLYYENFIDDLKPSEFFIIQKIFLDKDLLLTFSISFIIILIIKNILIMPLLRNFLSIIIICRIFFYKFKKL